MKPSYTQPSDTVFSLTTCRADAGNLHVQKLERVLADGRSNCHNFREIFKVNPSRKAGVASGQFLDMLAEVEAYRWLKKTGFTALSKLPERGGTTVDFTAEWKGTSFGVEVTRLGVPKSSAKTVAPIERGSCFVLFDGKIAHDPIERSLDDAVNNKLAQVRQFRHTNRETRTMLIISTGRGLLLSGKNSREEAGTLARTYSGALRAVLDDLDVGARAILDFAVLLDGKDDSAYPELSASPGTQTKE